MTCKVPWCLGIPRPESDVCTIHAKWPLYEPLSRRFPDLVDNPAGWVITAEGTECPTCGGTGEHDCHDCGDYHDCGACEGEGTRTTFRAENLETGEVREYEELVELQAEFRDVERESLPIHVPEVQPTAHQEGAPLWP